MGLVERFTIVGVSAPSHFLTSSKLHFAKPIRVGKSLPRHPDDVGVAALQNRFSLRESRDATRRNDWSIETRGVNDVFDLRNERDAEEAIAQISRAAYRMFDRFGRASEYGRVISPANSGK